MNKPGDRVGAILKADEKTIHLLGFGVYDGDFPMPRSFVKEDLLAEIEADLAAEGRKLEMPTNPRITLDNGNQVWGCQCWWGPEEKIRKMIADGRTVINATIEQTTPPAGDGGTGTAT